MTNNRYSSVRPKEVQKIFQKYGTEITFSVAEGIAEFLSTLSTIALGTYVFENDEYKKFDSCGDDLKI